MRITILLFRPELDRSRANRALAGAAAQLPGVDVVDMYGLYPDGAIDADREVSRLLASESIVLQFPIRWYSTPPLLQEWQDRVLTRMFYVNPESEGARLAGMPLMIAATAGNRAAAYTPEGQNLFPLSELLRPLQATAHRCGFAWSAPFLVYEANKRDAASLAEDAADYVDRLRSWRTDRMKQAA